MPERKLRELEARWRAAEAGERANYQLYLTELCEAIEVERPRPAGSGYQFELPIQVISQDGTSTTRFADLAKAGHFVLEAKDEETGRGSDLLLRRAFGQAIQYTAFIPGGHPPYLMVLDVGSIAERLDMHRKSVLDHEAGVTMTAMYNVVEKLRTGEALNEREREIHDRAACGVLRDLHDTLDAAVAEAYRWPWPLEREEILARVVDLHDIRAEHERRGKVKWLRPDYQIPRFAVAGEDSAQTEIAATVPQAEQSQQQWPSEVLAQLNAVLATVNTRANTGGAVAQSFRGAPQKDVEKHLEALCVLGVVVKTEDGRFHSGAQGLVSA